MVSSSFEFVSSFGRGQGVVVFIQARVVGFISVRWVLSGASCVSSVSFVFIPAR